MYFGNNYRPLDDHKLKRPVPAPALVRGTASARVASSPSVHTGGAAIGASASGPSGTAAPNSSDTVARGRRPARSLESNEHDERHGDEKKLASRSNAKVGCILGEHRGHLWALMLVILSNVGTPCSTQHTGERERQESGAERASRRRLKEGVPQEIPGGHSQGTASPSRRVQGTDVRKEKAVQDAHIGGKRRRTTAFDTQQGSTQRQHAQKKPKGLESPAGSPEGLSAVGPGAGAFGTRTSALVTPLGASEPSIGSTPPTQQKARDIGASRLRLFPTPEGSSASGSSADATPLPIGTSSAGAANPLCSVATSTPLFHGRQRPAEENVADRLPDPHIEGLPTDSEQSSGDESAISSGLKDGDTSSGPKCHEPMDVEEQTEGPEAKSVDEHDVSLTMDFGTWDPPSVQAAPVSFDLPSAELEQHLPEPRISGAATDGEASQLDHADEEVLEMHVDDNVADSQNSLFDPLLGEEAIGGGEEEAGCATGNGRQHSGERPPQGDGMEPPLLNMSWTGMDEHRPSEGVSVSDNDEKEDPSDEEYVVDDNDAEDDPPIQNDDLARDPDPVREVILQQMKKAERVQQGWRKSRMQALRPGMSKAQPYSTGKTKIAVPRRPASKKRITLRHRALAEAQCSILSEQGYLGEEDTFFLEYPVWGYLNERGERSLLSVDMLVMRNGKPRDVRELKTLSEHREARGQGDDYTKFLQKETGCMPETVLDLFVSQLSEMKKEMMEELQWLNAPRTVNFYTCRRLTGRRSDNVVIYRVAVITDDCEENYETYVACEKVVSDQESSRKPRYRWSIVPKILVETHCGV